MQGYRLITVLAWGWIMDKKLKIKFITYELPPLSDDDIEELEKFIVQLAQQGFKDNIVSGNFPMKGIK